MANKILIVNQNAGYLTVDVANMFADSYEDVVLFCGLLKQTERKIKANVKIQRTFKYNRTSTVKRMISWSLFSAHLFFLLFWKYRKYKILYYTNPPTAYFNALVFSNQFSLVVFDAYPAALKLVGIKDSSFIFKIWGEINKIVFARAHSLITLSDGMKIRMQDYSKVDKFKVVHLWSASDKLKPVSKVENNFLERHGWQEKFIIQYSGNMGIGHKTEFIVEVAEKFSDITEVLFLIIGEGSKKDKLVTLVDEKGLKNIKFLTWQPASDFPHSLAAADLAIIALEPEVTHASVPSKTFNCMAVGLPIIGIGGNGSELQSLIVKHEMGIYFGGDDSAEIYKFIMNAFQDPELVKRLSENSLAASQLYTFTASRHYLF